MSQIPETALPRETGNEKSTAECPNCGAELPVVETPYGSTSTGVCSKCWPEGEQKPADQLQAQQAAANGGSQPPAPASGSPASGPPV